VTGAAAGGAVHGGNLPWVGKLARIYQATCAGCEEAWYSMRHTKREAERELRRDGWRRRASHGWFCEQCAAGGFRPKFGEGRGG
jgi:hypothetical protein